MTQRLMETNLDGLRSETSAAQSNFWMLDRLDSDRVDGALKVALTEGANALELELIQGDVILASNEYDLNY